MSFNIHIAATASGKYLIGAEAIARAERDGEWITDRDQVCSTQLKHRCVAQVNAYNITTGRTVLFTRLCTPTVAGWEDWPVLATYQDAIHSTIRSRKNVIH